MANNNLDWFVNESGFTNKKKQNTDCNEDFIASELKALSTLSLNNSTDNINVDSDQEDNEKQEEETNSCVTENDGDHADGLENEIPTCNITVDPPNEDQSPSSPNNDQHNSLFFKDGERSIDYVLAWKYQLIPDNKSDVQMSTKEREDLKTKEKLRSEKRENFEENLIKEGLELESDIIFGEIHIVKIHAPIEVLRRYAEILKLRLPMKESLCSIDKLDPDELTQSRNKHKEKIPGLTTMPYDTSAYIKKKWKKIVDRLFMDQKHFPPISHRFTAIYSRDKEYLFDLSEESIKNLFNSSIRARIVQFILERVKYSKEGENGNDFSFGIERLISDEAYIAAYPLHDGDLNSEGSKRNSLYQNWASMKKFYQYQPLDAIKDYFGVKIGIYFAWLGFYTYMLIIASIVGLLSFLYSLKWMKYNPISDQICDINPNKTIIMCPLCDKLCDYWDLQETCLQAKLTSLCDNPVTVIFAVIMSFWAALFLEQWKRYSAEITHRWDLTGFDLHEEHPRPEYLAKLKHLNRKKTDYVTNETEPHPPFWRMKLPAKFLSFSVVLLLIMIALAGVLGIVLYRMSVMAVLSVYGKELTTSFAILITTVTAASINLILIFILNYFYEYLAEWLTECELLRTQTEFDDSLTLKIYLLQFINYYASIFYIAFFKGKFIGTPKAYNRFFDYRQEECGLGGCLMELMLQLAIIMIGKQFMNACLEYAWPLILKHWNKLSLNTDKKRESLRRQNLQYVKDLKLVEFGSRGLFPEYLEMVLQYGFVTIFVAAFPLAPLFALINNIFEMRFDAKKLLVHYRRTAFPRVQNIGIWYRILDCISKLAVITNGFIIAFTSDFVPRIVYVMFYSKNNSLDGYVEFSLSKFNTSEFSPGAAPLKQIFKNEVVTECRYQDFRYDSGHPQEYERTAVFWNIMAARLIFVVIFENTVAIVMLLVRWLIPDVSRKLKDQIRRETYITNEIIIKQEALRASRINSARTRKNWGEVVNKTYRMTGSQLDLYIESHPSHHRNDYEEDEESQPINRRISKADVHHRKNSGTNV